VIQVLNDLKADQILSITEASSPAH
jgi:hypothetical protein